MGDTVKRTQMSLNSMYVYAASYALGTIDWKHLEICYTRVEL